MNFDSERLIDMQPVPNAVSGVVQLEAMILAVLSDHPEFKYVLVGMESTVATGYNRTPDRHSWGSRPLKKGI